MCIRDRCLARELAEAGVAVDACVGSATAAKLVGVEDFEALGAGEVRVATDEDVYKRQALGWGTTRRC